MAPKFPPGHGSGRIPGSSRGGRGEPPATPLRSGGSSQLVQIPAHIKALGVKRPDYGSGGTPLEVFVNAYQVEFDEGTIYHYDDINPSSVSARLNMKLITHLQTSVAPEVFNPPAVYDGKKNLFSSHRLSLGNDDTQTFTFLPPDALPESGTGKSKRAARQYKVKLTKVNQINTTALKEYLNRRQSSDEFVLTALTALNVATRMSPAERYTFTTRSFFTAHGKQPIGRGIELWRGVFQSLRPTLYRLIMNVDTTTGVMYKPGPLIELCQEYLGSGPNLNSLSPPRGLNDLDRKQLQTFITNLRVVVTLPSSPPRILRIGVIKGVSRAGANSTKFEVDGRQITIEQYFQQKYNIRLRSPQIFCVQIGSRDALYPAEMCQVIEGQSVPRHKLPHDKTKDVVEFSSVPPTKRFQNIQNGVNQVLAFGQSNYIQQFGMTIDTTKGFLRVKARVLNPTKVQYGKDSKPATFEAKDGSWNLMGKRFYKPETIMIWAIVVYDDRFKDQQVSEMIKGIIEGCASLGIKISDPQPFVKREYGQGNIVQQFQSLGTEVKKNKNNLPNLVFVVLPDGGDDIYRQIKHFGDIMTGVATQCVKSRKAFKAKPQYWANVLAKVNAKLGGINHVLEPRSVSILKDDKNPLIVMGADVMHPGASNRPSYTALVGSIDSLASKYVSTIRAQTSRREMIDDLEEMCNEILNLHQGYKKAMEKANWPPKRLIFFRDGVSEGQFSQVLSEELPMIRHSCEKYGFKPKITLLVVGKRHHFRFMNPGNTGPGHTPSGTTVDTDITNPIDFEWYTQSHKPLLGTSRPAHYTVLHDDSEFDSNTLQSFAYAMCHVYARSTGAVSIPAPVYYADTICARAPIHYAPGTDPSSLSETMTDRSDAEMLEQYKKKFKPINQSQAKRMYFM